MSEIMKRRLPAVLLLGSYLALSGGVWNGDAAAAPSGRWSVLEMPATTSSPAAAPFLIAITRAGDRLVAAGERGIVFLSDDNGTTWRQAAVPVNVTLTAVRFASPRRGWAIGHFGVVLRTDDGGETWTKQLDGMSVAAAFLKDAREKTGADGASEAVRAAERLVQDGPDKPFLDLLVFDERRALVLGAYGLAMRTEDGGTSWTPASAAIDNQGHWHLNAGAATPNGQDIYIVGEQGSLFRSQNGGATFEALTSPYEGSLFAALATSSDDVIIVGLRGNAFRSSDRGMSWTKVELAGAATMTSAIRLRDGTALLADQAGQIYRRTGGGSQFQRVEAPVHVPVSGLVEAANGAVLAVGPAGVQPILSAPSTVLPPRAQ
ncbi:YCF48-related protein [Azospirillum sp. INR13]|uniref:WD40/YVTN/BNR-like repeat-containing protein n=1 Tax=Azospirillum sp. INR13 TaxID=2596919 RepID=UPI0018926374|nr:YCF48-related protein [Azospirillum sp. INR13]